MGHSCYRERRDGERRRKSVRGCIVDANLSVLAVVIVKKGEQEIPGLTDVTVPKRLDLNVPPRSASRSIFPRKMMSLSMSSSDHFPSKRERNRSTAHPRSKDW